MRITDVEAIILSLPQIRERTDGSQDMLLVKVSTDAGIVGYGEVDSSPLVAKSIIDAPISHTISRGLRHLVLGEDPFAYEYLWHRMYEGCLYHGRRGAAIQAMSGIDLALWDIMGKALEMPVYKLLGGGFRKEVRAYASALFGDDLADTADKVKRYVDQGFTAVKMGWEPMGQDPAYDVALVRTMREAAGPKADILIDAGLCWDAKTAIRMARRFEEFDIFWLEEPLHPDNLEGYRRLSEAVDVRIAAGEEESSRAGFVDLMDRGKIDVVQVDVTRVGGLTEAKKIAFLAHDRGLPCINHSFTTDLNVAASLHLLASIPNAPLLEFCVEESPLRTELAREPIRVVDGMVRVPEEPGLGVELDEAVIERYRIA
uniref:Mandelate racemase/muconate lactonizing enzyme family protein n=1 Tax=uncultured Armatimonadetes bacterium TaxID=157466 RepID=A0A6J4JZU6_9BACT|nr:mandelate racemase/muconate lactonizing enzyme family protein [uncultured Armatimonadetes bacterium]